jgi:hypothetical protein
MSAGFSALRGMTQEQVARAMGDSISRWINSQKIMFAFHHDQSLKERYIARVKAHPHADETGAFGVRSRGCTVGYTIYGSELSCYETELGIPRHIASLQDCIFENLSPEERSTFPLAFLEAIPVGADLSLVIPRFLVWLLSDRDGVWRVYCHRGEQAIKTVVALYQRLSDGGAVSKEEWFAAHHAAWGSDATAAVHAVAGAGGNVDIAGAIAAEAARAEAEAARAKAETFAAQADADARAARATAEAARRSLHAAGTYSGASAAAAYAEGQARSIRYEAEARAKDARAQAEARARTATETYAAVTARAAANALHAEITRRTDESIAAERAAALAGPIDEDDYYTYWRDYDSTHGHTPFDIYGRTSEAAQARPRYYRRMRDKLLELLQTAPVPN